MKILKNYRSTQIPRKTIFYIIAKHLQKQLKNHKDNRKNASASALVWQNLVQLHLLYRNASILMKWHSYMKKSCNKPSESNLQYQSTLTWPPPSPVYAKFREKKTKLTQWVRSVVYLAKNGKLIRPWYFLSSSCQTLIMTLRSSLVPCWRWFHWKRNDLLKLELVNFYMY